jgi:hypothetical protein
MDSYAVTLRRDGGASPASGRLEIERGTISFHGRDGTGAFELTLPLNEVVAARKLRLGSLRTARIETRALDLFFLTSLGRIGLLTEILDAIKTAV